MCSKIYFSFIVFLIFCGIVGCSTDGDKTLEGVEALKQTISKYQNAVNNHDIAAYMDLFMDDVLWASSNAPVARSKAELQKYIQSSFDKAIFNIKITPLEIKLIDNFAYIIGDAKGIVKSKNMDQENPLQITVIWIFQKRIDEWKIFRQISTNNKTN
jgi:uncharacterized protein (TIGR02246 family)